MSRRAPPWLALTVGCWAAAAQAQVELEQLTPAPAARGSLLVGNGQLLQGGGYRVSTAFSYAHAPLRTTNFSGGSQTLLRDRLTLHVLGAVGLNRWLELGADLPFSLTQSSQVASFAPATAGMGTPFLQAKVALLDRSHFFTLAAALGLGLPVGSAAALGNGGLAWAPRLEAGRAFDDFQVGIELGALARPQVALERFPGTGVGSQLYLAATVSAVGDGLRGEVSGRGYLSLSGAAPGLEVLAGVRYPSNGIELFALLGPGIGGAPATPNFRLLLGLALGNAGPPLGRCDARYDYPVADCPELDKDGDGVKNGVDLAPTEPEDKDGFEDEDGKPDPDNDQDGILDVDDSCPDERGPRELRGCPGPTNPDQPAPRPLKEPEPADPPPLQE